MKNVTSILRIGFERGGDVYNPSTITVEGTEDAVFSVGGIALHRTLSEIERDGRSAEGLLNAVTLITRWNSHNSLVDALTSLLAVVDETAERAGFCDRGERAAARAVLATVANATAPSQERPALDTPSSPAVATRDNARP